MRALFRKILRALFSDYYQKKQVIDLTRSRKRTIIISPVQGTSFKLAGMKDARENDRSDSR